MSAVTLTIGLGFGDEGKGLTVDYLTRTSEEPVTVVRFSGGAQAAHNVVLPDGRHHTFRQFGSGALAGAETHLSKYMLVNPLSLDREEEILKEVGVPDPQSKITLSGDALITTIYHIAANRLREQARGDNRHGSCGMGVNETVTDGLAHPMQALRVKDLLNPDTVRAKLTFSRRLKHSQVTLQDEDPMSLILEGGAFDSYVDSYVAFGEKYREQIVQESYLKDKLDTKGHVIFEGSQGVLLDETEGFFPHVTRSKTNFTNAYNLLTQCGYNLNEVHHLGITRSYMTRHGAGPMPSETLPVKLPQEKHNQHGVYQGGWRTGPLDLVLLAYARKAAGYLDGVVVTHMDAVYPKFPVCTNYNIHGTAMYQLPRRTSVPFMDQCQPELDWADDEEDLLASIEHQLDAPVTLTSYGPTWKDVRCR